MTNEQKPQEPKVWTTEEIRLAASVIYAGIGKLVRDSELTNAPDGKAVVLRMLMGCTAYFAVRENISRHDMIDMAKTTFDEIAALQVPDPNVS